MARYVFQARRGWKWDSDPSTGLPRDDWAAYDARPDGERRDPAPGEIVIEYDNGIPRLKIGDGINKFSDLPYMSVDSFIISKVATINLLGGDAWTFVSEGRYTQDITSQIKDKITPHSKIDLQVTPEQLCVFHEKDVAFTTVNENGNVRVCAIGIRPEQNYEGVHITITEVAESGVIVGNTTATPNPQPDWKQSNSNKADYIKNKPLPDTSEEDDGKIIEIVDGAYVLKDIASSAIGAYIQAVIEGSLDEISQLLGDGEFSKDNSEAVSE